MTHRTHIFAAIALASATACGGGNNRAATTSQTSTLPPATTVNTPVADTATYQHHSKLAGAAVGAAAGHMLGGHAVLGAAAGAIIQHERNKHQAARP